MKSGLSKMPHTLFVKTNNAAPSFDKKKGHQRAISCPVAPITKLQGNAEVSSPTSPTPAYDSDKNVIIYEQYKFCLSAALSQSTVPVFTGKNQEKYQSKLNFYDVQEKGIKISKKKLDTADAKEELSDIQMILISPYYIKAPLRSEPLKLTMIDISDIYNIPDIQAKLNIQGKVGSLEDLHGLIEAKFSVPCFYIIPSDLHHESPERFNRELVLEFQRNTEFSKLRKMKRIIETDLFVSEATRIYSEHQKHLPAYLSSLYSHIYKSYKAALPDFQNKSSSCQVSSPAMVKADVNPDIKPVKGKAAVVAAPKKDETDSGCCGCFSAIFKRFK